MVLSHGARHSVMIKLDKPETDYTIRLAGDGLNQKIYTSGILSYKGGDHTVTPNASIDYAGAPTSPNVRVLNDKIVIPYPPVAIAKTADQTHKLTLTRPGAAWEWSLANQKPFPLAFEDMTPLLWQPHGLDGTGLSISTKNGTWVDLIFIVTNVTGLQPPHPIHKHSNKAHIIVSTLFDSSGLTAG